MSKKLIITGSEGLIGKKLCEHFCDQFDLIKLDLSLGHDLTNEKFVSSFFEDNKGLYGVIICHAFNPIPQKNIKKVEPVDFPLNEVRDYFEVNVLSAYDICRNFIKNNKKGRIVNITSLYGRLSPKHHIYNNFTKHIGYSLSKSSVVMLSKYLATYYKNFNINTVVLGGVRDERQEDEFVKNYSSNTPAGRLMNINEVPPVFDFLLNEKSTYVTGTEIEVDGGWNAW